MGSWECVNLEAVEVIGLQKVKSQRGSDPFGLGKQKEDSKVTEEGLSIREARFRKSSKN